MIKSLYNIDYSKLQQQVYNDTPRGEWMDNDHNYKNQGPYHIVDINHYNKYAWYAPLNAVINLVELKQYHTVVAVLELTDLHMKMATQQIINMYNQSHDVQVKKVPQLGGLMIVPKSVQDLPKELESLYNLAYQIEYAGNENVMETV